MQPKRRSPAGCFLKIVAALIILVLAGALAYRLFERQLMELAFVSSAEFQDVPMPPSAIPSVRRSPPSRPTASAAS